VKENGTVLTEMLRDSSYCVESQLGMLGSLNIARIVPVDLVGRMRRQMYFIKSVQDLKLHR
jgi:hypothetical protein